MIAVDPQKIEAEMARKRVAYSAIDRKLKRAPGWTANAIKRIRANGACQPKTLHDLAKVLGVDVSKFMAAPAPPAAPKRKVAA